MLGNTSRARFVSCFYSRYVALTFAAAFAATLIAQPALAADAVDRQRVRQQVAAGEFTLARQAAQSIADVSQRDQLLGEIAQAQVQMGARAAALGTAEQISSDQARTDLLRDGGWLGAATPVGRRGGSQADFDSLIELITSTIAPTTWDEVGGPGSIQEFQGGVYVDATGLLARQTRNDLTGGLAALRETARPASSGEVVRRASTLRKVSLPRLERAIALRLAEGKQPTEAMRLLAGLSKIRYVFIYPDTGDVVLAGPAGDWTADADGRPVSRQDARPVLRLDDLLVVLRHMNSAPDARFGCSITPTRDGLARTQSFLAESSKQPLKPGQRDAWLQKLRGQLGRQDITVQGIDSRTHAAQVLIEADYRMKLVGMGLEEGALGVTSYLGLLQPKRGEPLPPMDVLRWWFTMNYEAVVASPGRDAFELRGQGVQVLSENELLTALGERVHTGQSESLNHEFAAAFTKHFPALAAKYPIYAELANLFDLALAAAVVRTQSAADRAGWHMLLFNDAQQLPVAVGFAPQTVETVINHRVINQTTIVAGVSGGVHADPWKHVQAAALQTDRYGKLAAEQASAAPNKVPRERWWWD